MRVLMVTSFPIPGEYDGTAMLPIKIMRALRSRGVEVVHAHLRARPPWGRATRGERCPQRSSVRRPTPVGDEPAA